VSTAGRSSAPRSKRPGGSRPGLAARTVATSLYSEIIDRRRPLDRLIDAGDGDKAYRALPPRDRRLVHAIVAAALRHRGEIADALGQLMERKPPKSSGRLPRILEIAAAQILFMDVADHATVSIAVDQVAADKGAQHFKGLANAVLRRLARDKDTIRGGHDPALLDTPDWLWSRWRKTYGEAEARRIAEAHLVEPPLDLSVKSDAEGWAEKLGGVVLPTGSVRLVPSGPVEELPGYADGEWWVQDAAAALPAKLLADVAGKQVADLCAAPGGKTAALAAAGAKVTAVDISEARVARLRTNLSRLKLEAETVVADILEWRPPAPFDAVLLDAPCSATGTIRRHPDIVLLKKPEDIASLAALQERMIDRAVAMLKPGGILVYCTCSLEPEEGEAQFERALSRHGLTPLPVDPAEVGGVAEIVTPKGTIRTLPHHLPHANPRLSGLDGFFIGRGRKGG
jgi:16S rRNA (cytosine967-C5)-methyltransferase